MANPVTWFEIIGPDADTLHRFYKDVFDWKLTPPVKEMGNYSMLQGHEPGIGGGIGGAQDDSSRVSVYIESSTPEAHLNKAIAAGAKMLMPVTTITPDTTIAMFLDPAGNTVGILKANPRRPSASDAAAQAAARSNGSTRRRSATRKKAGAARTSAKKSSGRKTTARKRTKRR
jgi:hypothetical protein